MYMFCPHCNKFITQLDGLHGHILYWHLLYKPYKCAQPFCSEDFLSEKLLNKHCQMKHNGDKKVVIIGSDENREFASDLLRQRIISLADRINYDPKNASEILPFFDRIRSFFPENETDDSVETRVSKIQISDNFVVEKPVENSAETVVSKIKISDNFFVEKPVENYAETVVSKIQISDNFVVEKPVENYAETVVSKIQISDNFFVEKPVENSAETVVSKIQISDNFVVEKPVENSAETVVSNIQISDNFVVENSAEAVVSKIQISDNLIVESPVDVGEVESFLETVANLLPSLETIQPGFIQPKKKRRISLDEREYVAKKRRLGRPRKSEVESIPNSKFVENFIQNSAGENVQENIFNVPSADDLEIVSFSIEPEGAVDFPPDSASKPDDVIENFSDKPNVSCGSIKSRDHFVADYNVQSSDADSSDDENPVIIPNIGENSVQISPVKFIASNEADSSDDENSVIIPNIRECFIPISPINFIKPLVVKKEDIWKCTDCEISGPSGFYLRHVLNHVLWETDEQCFFRCLLCNNFKYFIFLDDHFIKNHEIEEPVLGEHFCCKDDKFKKMIKKFISFMRNI